MGELPLALTLPACAENGYAGILCGRNPARDASGARLPVDCLDESATRNVETIRCSSLASEARLPQAPAVSSALMDEAWVRFEICAMLTLTCSAAEFCCEAAVAMRATMLPTSSDKVMISAMERPDS